MTAIPYPDIVAHSPSRRFRLDIRSPDNDPIAPRAIADLASGHPRRCWTNGFQSDFVYTVASAETADILWQRRTEGSLDCPAEAWVADNGAVLLVTRTGFTSELVLLSSRGDVALRCDVLTELLDNREAEFCWTSAGPYWTEGGHGLFVSAAGKCFWSFRNLHGRRIVVNVTDGRHEVPTASVLAEIRGAEAEWARETLADAAADSPRWQDECDETYELQMSQARTAAFWAACDGLADTIALLQRLEFVPAISGYGFVSWETRLGDKLYVGRYLLRPMVQLALRMLGQEPAGAPCYTFRVQVPDRDFTECPEIAVPVCIPDRAARLERVRADMQPQDVLELIGVPDFFPSRDCWDYDFVSADSSFTFRIDWNRDTWRPESLSTLQPAAWCNLEERLPWLRH